MRMTHLFTKTSKSVAADAETVNAKYLVQGGFVHQEMAGVYSWLPLGLRVLRKVEEAIRVAMDDLGAQEILMSALQPKENWVTTKRWDSVDVLFKIPSQTNKEYGLGPTHEEIVTPLVQQFVKSYRDLPTSVYQIQTKFRDELRAKSGILRGREFGMKDMYSFHTTVEDFDAYYQKVMEAYVALFTKLGVAVKVVEASGGSFTKKHSHEFQVITSAGEDHILACPNCTFAQNSEIATFHAGDACPSCGGILIEAKGVEAGNIFDLGQKFSQDFGFEVDLEDGTRQNVFMGCYGIGISRLVGTIVEASHDEKGIIWPAAVAPFDIHLVTLNPKDEEAKDRVNQAATDLYDQLKAAGHEVLWDDRDARAGEKLADADLIGIPVRLLISEKTLAEGSVEWKNRNEAEAVLVKMEDVGERMQSTSLQLPPS
ncbi:hypothetical protein KBC54_04450 [Patescibacteria group bacterium]|nr:hypothetical protein [Patescibacteria group bacterium]